MLDELDKAILALLQEDASLATADIAKRVGLSQSPCWRRIARLQEDGFIKRHVALLDADKVGYTMTVFATVGLSDHGRKHLSDFEVTVSQYPEVQEVYTVAGNTDYLLKITTRDMASYELFLREKLLTLTHVRSINSNVAMSCIKHSTALPL